MLLLDRILTHIVNHLSNTSYHFQYLYYPGGNETGAKPNLITCITEIFLSAGRVWLVTYRQGTGKAANLFLQCTGQVVISAHYSLRGKEEAGIIYEV
jgi:hypothetical protein